MFLLFLLKQSKLLNRWMISSIRCKFSISNRNYFHKSKFIHNAFILFLTISSILFSSCNKEILYTKKAYCKEMKGVKTNYVVFNKPYFKKKPTVFTRLLKLSVGIGTGYYFYLYPEQFLTYVSDPSIIGAATGVAGFTLSAAVLGISGGGRKTIQIRSNNDQLDWLEQVFLYSGFRLLELFQY